MNKKGVEISMNVIIVAAIGLLVLVVLSVIFLGRIGGEEGFAGQVGKCEVQGGKCAPECGNADYGTSAFKTKNPLISCPDDTAGDKQVCCLPVQA